MTTTMIRGIPIKFPFKPYPLQIDYMEKVIECLDTHQNGILESPTGTGKTLSLLCATLGWLESRKESQKDQIMSSFFEKFEDETMDTSNDKEDATDYITIPKVIYASRTHTQIHQAMQEMKRTAYSNMKACVLGSREQMCIDPEVQNERNNSFKINICRNKVKRRSCCFYNHIENAKNNDAITSLNIIDMEDIVNLGQCHNFCPYYMTRELKSGADVIFMPYNYLLDPKLSKNMAPEVYGSVVILDEAHNIEKVCEESVSVQIRSTDLEAAIEDVSAIIDLLETGKQLDVDEIKFTPTKLKMLNEILITLKNSLISIPLMKLALEGTVFDGDYIFEILEKSGVLEANYTGITDLIDSILEFTSTTKSIQRRCYALEILNNLLFVVFYKKGPEFRQKIKECFKVQIEEEQTEQFRNRRFSQTVKAYCRILNFWCFSPGFGMNMLMDQNVHCVILTSGTLAPLKPLISELELDVGVKIENPHIVESNQVCVKILSSGPDNVLLNSNFQNRNNPKYLQSLGLVISNLIRVIPDGVLIFFPSYIIMEKTIEHWQDDGIWDAMNRTKPVYIEPKDKLSFSRAMDDYYAKIQDPSYGGAIFMGVCRGKISEGLDFADINGRAVFITGLPYPPLKDPKIILKKRYLDFRSGRDKEYLKGDEWYSLEATRAINQAIGRVIRHRNDYGAIILLDSRFTNQRIKDNMSVWLRRHITDIKNFGEIVRSLRIFFQSAKENMPQPEVKQIAVEELVNLDASTSEENLVKIHSRKGEFLDQSPSKRFR